jgi:uncharacterized LabA/DUF88 family protein
MMERGIMRTALIVDVHNLYMTCSKKYPGKVVDYSVLSGEFVALGSSMFFKTAYGRQSEDKVETFAKALRRIGFDVRFGGGPYNIEMALQCAELVRNRSIDHLILGTSYFETIKILEYARSYGIYTSVCGFNVPEAFQRVADIRELDADHLQEKTDEVHGGSSILPFQSPTS